MAVAPRRQRRRPYGTIVILSTLVAGIGWMLYPRLNGDPIRDPFGLFGTVEASEPDEDSASDDPQPPAEGMVRVLISGREIPAYARVTRDDIFNSKRGTFAFLDVPSEIAEESGILVDAKDIVGRVMARAKRPGFAFAESDFLPEGTRPGLAGGTPSGKRAMRIEVDLVHGIIGLNPGDRFDLVAAHTVEGKSSAPQTAAPAGLAALVPSSQPQRPASPTRARVDVIVQNGVVVTPLETRLVPMSTTSLTSGPRTTTRPTQEMVIALDPEEVGPLMAALRLGADITCVARSGRPGESGADLTPGFDESDLDEPDVAPETDMHVVEVIHGTERTFVPVPRRVVDEPDPVSDPAEADDGD